MSAFATRAVRRDFSASAATYDAHSGVQKRALARCVELLIPHAPPGARVLDAGCGTGALAALAPGWEITGVDAAEGMCRAASYPLVINADIAALPLRDGYFDAAVCSMALQWVNSAGAALGELRRVVRPSGMLALSCVGPGTLRELRASFAQADGFPHVSDFPAAEAMAARAESAGWRVERREEEAFIAHAATFRALLGSLKELGATNKLEARRRGLMPPRVLKAAECYYEARFREAPGLRATWDLYYFLLRNE